MIGEAGTTKDKICTTLRWKAADPNQIIISIQIYVQIS